MTVNSSGNSSGLRWLVLGSTGFVGSAIVAELRDRGFDVDTLSAPRLLATAETAGLLAEEARAAAASAGATFVSLRQAFAGADVVVNAAGLATPGDGESPALTGANALLPAVIALAARAAGVRRLVHLSSASVQGHRRVIDEGSDRAPFSAYSRSKALGEEVLELLAGNQPLRLGRQALCLRPAGSRCAPRRFKARTGPPRCPWPRSPHRRWHPSRLPALPPHR